MNLINLGNYHYHPSKILEKRLKEVIIFAENTKKRDIPNGSVFVYEDSSYNPSILKTDVGCGITAFTTEGIDFNAKSTDEILKVVNDIDIHIGQGNHFLDFTIGHPTIKKKSNMIYLHSDFNNENILPETYSQAKDLEKKASDMRIQYLEKLTSLLGISARFYKDWVHNSVTIENDLLIYRKGSINLQKTEGVGVLALNPIDGLLLYAGDFKEYRYSAQHGLGRSSSKGELLRKLTKKTKGIARCYITSSINPEIDKIKNNVYNSIDNFLDKHHPDFSQIGICSPELVITTKKSGNK